MNIKASELIINADGSIYHLGIKPNQISDLVILVGDPDRVPRVSSHFDHLEHQLSRREFRTHIGSIGNQRITVISTGIGTDNIDIVLNELDALVNIDFNTKAINSTLRSLKIIRIGTSGALQPDIDLESVVVSSASLGLDGLMHFYQPLTNQEIIDDLLKLDISWPLKPYFEWGNESLVNIFSVLGQTGITLTNAGFYGPQGRQLRIFPKVPNLLDLLKDIKISQYRITNLEMETSGIYGISRLTGHDAVSLNAILANRPKGTFVENTLKPIDALIRNTLELITSNRNFF